jgi:hypothetical protein
MEQYRYLIDNQRLWSKQYAEQEKLKKEEQKKENREKEWYGKTKEYMNEWKAQNKRKYVKQNSNIPNF